MHGQRVRVKWSEARANGRLFFIEAAPGIVTVLPEWMLDPVACAGMEMGTPQLTVDALITLQRLLTEGGFTRSSPDDATIVRKKRHEKTLDADAAGTSPAPVQHGLRLREAADDQPSRARHDGRAVGPPPDGSGRRRNGGA